MRRKRVRFEWSAADEFNTEARAVGHGATVTIWRDEDETRSLARYFPCVAALWLAGLLCAASGPFSFAEWQAAHTQQAIEATIRIEQRALAQKDRALLHTLVDPAVAPDLHDELLQLWRLYSADVQALPQQKIVNVRVWDNIAMVQMLLTSQPPQPPVTSIQHRFYRNVGERWLYTQPDVALWGRQQRFETEHLRFEFGELDRQVVLATAPRIDAAYVQLYELIGVDLPTAPTVLTVVPYPASTSRSSPNQHLISSPLTATDFLADSEENAFLFLVMMDLIPPLVNQLHTPSRWTPGAPWNAVSGGFQSWLMQEVTGQPHPWKGMTEPEFLRIYRAQAPLRLAELSNPVGIASSDEWLWRQGAAELLIDFTAHHYGRQHIPPLVQNLAQYNTWDYVIPHVLGQSVSEFEDGWNRYLAQHIKE